MNNNIEDDEKYYLKAKNKAVLIFQERDRPPLVFETGNKYRYKPGDAVVEDIIICGQEIRIYFNDKTFIFFNGFPYEYHGKLNSTEEGEKNEN